MTPAEIVIGVLVGLAAGILSGLFGVGGGVVTTPAIQHLLGGAPIEAVATPLPIIFPTSIVGAYTYARAGQVDPRAAAWAVPPGLAGTVAGAALTELVEPHILLLVTAVLLGWIAIQVIQGRAVTGRGAVAPSGWALGTVGIAAGFVSGLLGLGGGIIMVPAFATLLGMPLKRALGTSLLCISAFVVPGTVTHLALGHIDWAIFLVVSVGVIPGARVGARIALGARERALRTAVGVFLFSIAVVYAVSEVSELVRGQG